MFFYCSNKIEPIPYRNLHYPKMSQEHCSAFTDDWAPCLMTRLDGRDVCVLHTDFYVPNIWFERFIFRSMGKRIYIFSSPAKVQLFYKKAILDGHIKITKHHFKDLETHPRLATLVDYYLLCCRQPGVDPFWSMTLFKKTVETILDMHKPTIHDMLHMSPNFLHRFLDPLFSNIRWSFDYMMAQILFTILGMEHEGIQNIDHPSVSLFQYIKSHPKFQSEFLWKYSVHEENLMILVNRSKSDTLAHEKIKAFLVSFPLQRVLKRVRRHIVNGAMKKEITEAAWNPAWFLDHEEYRALATRWHL